uniref:Uncharacterized protein n=1 Tax=Siphoviridae sp. ctdau33 TaxID=2827902 RepID=A0A8S5S5Z3_9CAUD|nr:MAG TPA: hypothetical protein [Siphoviridae sp. ctdau33]
MVAMVKLHTAPDTAPAEQVKAQPHASLTRQPVSCMPAAAVAGNAEVEPVRVLAEKVVAAMGVWPLIQLLIPGRPIPAAEAAAELVIMIQPVVGSCKAEPAVLASCVSACTRRARERGKDNYAVIQERNEDGGIHSAVQQGAPQHRRHHNGAHTAPPGGGLGLAVGAGVLGLPVRAAVAHIPAEDGAEET